MRRSFLAIVLLAVCAALGAQEYPARAVRIVVPFAPGGGTDLIARILSQHLSQRLGQSFVVENRPAGSGSSAPITWRRARPTATRCFSRSPRSRVRRGMIDQGMDPAAGEPGEFAALIKADMEKWGDIGKRLGVKLD